MKTRSEGHPTAIALILATATVVPAAARAGDTPTPPGNFGDSAYVSHLQHLRQTSAALAERLRLYLPLGKASKIGAAIDVGHGTDSSVSYGHPAADGRSVAVGGEHQVNKRWLLQWEIGDPRMGDLPLRDGVRLGARYRF